MTDPTTGAVILAAGAGARLGGPKLRLESGGRPFLEQVLAAVVEAGCVPVVCVVRAEDRDWAAALADAAGAAVVVNPAPERG
ncbi:MAG TPA: NTP transferase domain-containing protein, partial [Acidobacteriota bacterium]|nr:NTP transferase domain-containing protein [Acidobacteriota bacterium]